MVPAGTGVIVIGAAADATVIAGLAVKVAVTVVRAVRAATVIAGRAETVATAAPAASARAANVRVEATKVLRPTSRRRS